MNKFMNVLNMTFLIFKSEADLTSTIPRVIDIAHLNLLKINNITRLTSSIARINTPVCLTNFDINRLSQTNLLGRNSSICWLYRHRSIGVNLNNPVTHSTNYNHISSIKLSFKLSINTSDNSTTLSCINCSL